MKLRRRVAAKAAATLGALSAAGDGQTDGAKTSGRRSKANDSRSISTCRCLFAANALWSEGGGPVRLPWQATLREQAPRVAHNMNIGRLKTRTDAVWHICSSLRRRPASSACDARWQQLRLPKRLAFSLTTCVAGVVRLGRNEWERAGAQTGGRMNRRPLLRVRHKPVLRPRHGNDATARLLR